MKPSYDAVSTHAAELVHFQGRFLYDLTAVIKSKRCSGCKFVLEYVILETCFNFFKDR